MPSRAENDQSVVLFFHMSIVMDRGLFYRIPFAVFECSVN